MSDIFPRVFVTHRRLVMAVWVLMAALNLAAAVVITSWPERQTDLDTIQRWGGNWLLQGDDIYAIDWDYPDYPPHAIVLLSPLGVMSLEWAVRSWSLINLPLLSIPAWVDAVLGHFDRALMLALFAATGILAIEAARVGSSDAAWGRADAAAEVVT